MTEKFYITTPIYYVNDKPHVGSAYTTIAADVLARFYRLSGIKTYFLTGTAEHGTKIQRAAEQASKKVEDFVSENAAKFSFAWDTLEVAPDDFIRTTEKRHEAAVIKFFEKLKESGKVYEGEYEGLYCVGHEAFVKETDLDERGLCPEHKKKPEKVKETNWFFRLSEYEEILRTKIKSGEFVIEPESRKNEVLSFIERGLEDIAISRQNVDWAIPLPWDRTQTIYVWLDELFNYCSAIGYGTDQKKFDELWPADIHLVGKDIIKFHCVIWPAVLEAVGLPWPKKVFAHGFFTIDGQKISKSLGNVIDPVDVANEYGPDALRYFLLREIPFGSDGDFSNQKLRDRYQADLANGLGNLFSRVANLIEKYCDGKLPEVVKSPRNLEDVNGLIQDLRFHEALKRIWEGIAWANKQIDETKLWELPEKDPNAFFENVSHLGALLLDIAKHLAPFMPDTANKIRIAIEADEIKKPEPLFPRLES
ncbi:MAG: methionine--tRNA ligase [Candidatus Magasanikbacteria bacterium CG10_big_fil_rev_8_21_14_0_10_40_10]|uniref:Methionine--tRNA ligase n=1 Tax=Candidatus Magasanikbacteria bacterium CG10_big_fil_rev_8_21_14_0_10_40_10 TaxID=1974648 RepID=A0A2M6W2L6_9BACT|nr:MAG: methionine--tRNA ligase [Candidatus Magasanikbacteria bacterium CG10_big_fil_rev_8_21_14_0_10_40_10]